MATLRAEKLQARDHLDLKLTDYSLTSCLNQPGYMCTDSTLTL